MTAHTLLHQLHGRGVILTPSPDGTLRYKAPKGTMTPALLDAIRQHKAALHGLVEAWSERTAIMQYDGHLTREEAEWQAFLFVCGEVEAMAQLYSEVSPYDP